MSFVNDVCDFNEVCNSKEFKESNNLSVCFGKDKDNKHIIFDLRDLGNIIIGEKIESGKDVFMHSIILELLLNDEQVIIIKTPFSKDEDIKRICLETKND